MAEWGKSDPVATWGAADPGVGSARDQGRAKSEQVWKRKLGSLTARNARGQTFEDFWQGYAKKNYDAEGRPAPNAPGGDYTRRENALRDARRRAGSTPGQVRATNKGFTFGVADEIDAAGAAVETGLNNALRRVTGRPDVGYGMRDAFGAVMQAERESDTQFAQDHPVQNVGFQVVGGIANPLNKLGGAYVQGASGAGQVGRAAAVGGAWGAAYGAGNARPGERLEEGAKGAVTGALTSGVLQLGGNALAGAARRKAALPPTPQRQLSAQGVDLTPGQMLGGGWQRAEDAMTSVPFTGDAIRNAQRRGIESFDRAALGRVLAPIGGTADDVGRAGVRDTSQQVSNAYNTALGGVQVAPDEGLAAGIRAVRQTPNLPPAVRQDLDAFLGDVEARLAGPIDGATWKALDADLGAAIRSADAGSASQPSQRFLRDALIRLRAEVGGTMQRANPEAFGAVRQADEASAMLARIREASQYQGTAAREGLFTASDLNRAVRGMDTSAGNRAYAQGNALLQDLAEPGVQVLPSTVPDSGTALRSAFTSSPQGLIVGGVTGIPASILYSQPVQGALNAIYRAQNGPQASAALQQLSQLAARQPALVPLVQELQRRLGGQGVEQSTAAPQAAPALTQ